MLPLAVGFRGGPWVRPGGPNRAAMPFVKAARESVHESRALLAKASRCGAGCSGETHPGGRNNEAGIAAGLLSPAVPSGPRQANVAIRKVPGPQPDYRSQACRRDA